MKLKISEFQIQCAYFDWVHLMEQKDERFKNIFAIPNGAYRHIKVAAKSKKEGQRAGVLDVAIMVPATPADQSALMRFPTSYNGAFIEFKAGKNKMTKEQTDFANRMKKQGYYCALCYSTEAAIDFTSWYFGLK